MYCPQASACCKPAGMHLMQQPAMPAQSRACCASTVLSGGALLRACFPSMSPLCGTATSRCLVPIPACWRGAACLHVYPRVAIWLLSQPPYLSILPALWSSAMPCLGCIPRCSACQTKKSYHNADQDKTSHRLSSHRHDAPLPSSQPRPASHTCITQACPCRREAHPPSMCCAG